MTYAALESEFRREHSLPNANRRPDVDGLERFDATSPPCTSSTRTKHVSKNRPKRPSASKFRAGRDLRRAVPPRDDVLREVVRAAVDGRRLDVAVRERRALVAQAAAQAEVADLQAARLHVDEQVRGLEVAVDDARRVDVVDAAERLVEEVELLVAAEGRFGVDDAREVRRRERRHDVEVLEVRGVRRLDDVVEPEHAGVVPVAHEAHLAQDPLRVDGVLEDVRDLLDRDVVGRAEALARLGGRVAGRRDAAVGAGADLLDELVLGVDLPRLARELHRRGPHRVARLGPERAHPGIAGRVVGGAALEGVLREDDLEPRPGAGEHVDLGAPRELDGALGARDARLVEHPAGLAVEVREPGPRAVALPVEREPALLPPHDALLLEPPRLHRLHRLVLWRAPGWRRRRRGVIRVAGGGLGATAREFLGRPRRPVRRPGRTADLVALQPGRDCCSSRR
jgi:hypothetical protein